MKRDEWSDLAAFVAVADAMSFTRAAAKLGLSASALSHAIRALEARLGLRLLARTTRSVRPTEAGEQLLQTLRPAFGDIEARLAALGELRDKPSGTVRVTTSRQAANTVLWPVLPRFVNAHPDVQVEITIDDGFTDIVANRYDAGIRFGEKVEKDMIAVRVGPDIRFAVVAAPVYFAAHAAPDSPHALAGHRCINYRLATAGGIYAWPFENKGRALQVRVEGPLIFNDGDMILAAALAGLGLACVYEDQVLEHLAKGRLVRVLTDWCPVFPGFHLYHPSRRQTPPALAALISALRFKP